ncbi:hypothetical protein [uncultured Piscinibacter sp.]|uniref:hypothetical protein n=1 Tax=uncultured Piscinibacter sp. TaxID=1131835 RepID=UPI002606D068|nr:hypothetical protein [uncultured Piscinibacter sp.]
MRRLAAAIALGFALPSSGALAGEAWEFGGYYKNLLARSRTVHPAGERYTEDLNRLRLELRGRPSPRFAIDVQYDNEILLGSYLDTRQFQLQQAVPPATYWDAQATYADGRDLHGEHRLHRASVTWSRDRFDLHVGRQRIAWGTGRFFSALDRLNPFSPTSLERSERPGVDALLAEFRPGALSRASAVLAPRRGAGGSSHALRWHANAGAADYSLIVGRFAGEEVVGADLATQVGGAGVRAELALVRAAGRVHARALVGVAHAFANSLSLSAEIYRDGTGADRSRDYDFAALFSGQRQTVGRDYVGAYAGCEITPLLKLNTDLVVNLRDGSHYLSPSLTWSLRPDVDAAIGAQWFAGRAASEYGTFNDLGFVQLQWYF